MDTIYQRRQETEYDHLSVGSRAAFAYRYTWYHTADHVRLAMKPAVRLEAAQIKQLLSELLGPLEVTCGADGVLRSERKAS